MSKKLTVHTIIQEEEIPDLRAMFSIGQPIICSITTLQDGKGEGAKKEDGPVSKRRIELSLRPDTINAQLSASDLVSGMMLPGMIASVMDHGYSVDFGLFDGITGFLKKSALPAGVESYSEGQWVYLPIQEFKNSSRVAKLTGKMDLKSMLIPSSHPLDMDSLRAGQLVQVTVKSIFESGLNVTFLGLFNGSIDWFNLGSVSFTDLESSFKLGQKFKARISYVDLSKKKFGLTLNEHLVQWTPAPLSNKLTTAEIGLIVEEAKVLRIDHQGLLLSLPSLGQGYVHVSHLSDSLVEKVEKKFKVGSTHRARVIGFDLVDSLFLVTLQASVLDQPIMRHADITVGSFIKGKILKVDTYGVVVGVTNTIRGLCPISHMSDAKLSSPSKMFKVGSTMKFQVVSVDVKEKKVLLTHHKSWMNSKLPNVTSYAEAQPGMITQGLVTSVRDFGCIVNFYSNVHALVPVSELAEAFVQKASDLFTVGQVVKCRILSVDAAEGKMRASFKLHGQSAEQVSPELLASILIGQLVKGKVVTLVQDGVVVDINGTGARGLITKQHLSDHLSHGEKLLSLMKEGQDIPYLVVLSKDRGQIHLTAKPSLIQYAQSPSSVVNPQEYKVGMIIPGYIKNVTETACFIAFVGGFVAMATSHNIADTFVTNAADHFEKGQSVVASVAKIDEAASKVFVSLKESVLGHSSEIKAFELARLQTFFQERSHVRASLLKPGKEAEVQEWADNFSIGCGVQGSVKAVVPYGTILDLDLGGTGLITLSDKGAHKFGQKLCGQVLDIDISKKILDLKQVETVDNARANKDKKTIKKV